ncbi:MAG: hypothetical protein ACXVPU_10760 [Bacteroidia bacterium]
MQTFENLNASEKEMLLKFPAYISLLAANADGKMDENEKKEAIRLTHIKTYSVPSELSDFYREAEKVFEKNIRQLDEQLPMDKETRKEAIKSELSKLKNIFIKLGREYSSLLKQSIRSYMDHVSESHSNLVESFLFPIHIDGLTD